MSPSSGSNGKTFLPKNIGRKHFVIREYNLKKEQIPFKVKENVMFITRLKWGKTRRKMCSLVDKDLGQLDYVDDLRMTNI